MLTARQSVELFQLVFLRALVAKGDDKSLFALKGGCNLRFYFGSVRHSEDIDLDVAVVAKETLKGKVDRLLRSPVVLTALGAKGIELVETSASKQTETTQRWKAGLRVPGLDLQVRTKIEFSRRSAITGTAFEIVDAAVLRPHGLTPFLATHYTTSAAIEQKVRALAGRAEPQARDVFDLNLLFARPDAAAVRLDSTRRELDEAALRALGVGFDQYRSQVVAYLDPGQAEIYSERAAWDAMQETVISRIEALR